MLNGGRNSLKCLKTQEQRMKKKIYDCLLHSEKYELKVILTEANEVSEVEESIVVIKISRLRPAHAELRSI
jgi:hypothetical protein